MDKETLIQFGLSHRESEAYYNLLQTDDSLASELSHKTKESRTNTYDTLNSLIKKGLVSYVIKTNKKYFMATHPEKILEWIELKKDKIEQERKDAERIIPDLIRMKLPNEKKVIVEVFEGIEGMRSMLKEQLDSAKKNNTEILVFGAIAGSIRDMDPIYHKRHYEEKKQKKVKSRYIFTEGDKHPIAPYSQYRYLAKHYKRFPATAVHGDEVSFWLMTTPATVILIKNKEFADDYRSNFEILWKLAKPTKKY